MGHPVNVVFHQPHPHHPDVSPVVHCYHGGDALFRDLRQVIDGAPGPSQAAVKLALRWATEYGLCDVGMYNSNTPGLPDTKDPAVLYPIHLAHLRRTVAADPQWVLVDLAEFRAVSQHGEWDLDGPAG